jgi:hypothetical protein
MVMVERHRRFFLLMLFSMSLGVPQSNGSSTASSPLKEEEAKVLFVYNFAKFAEWPGEALQKSPDQFTIGIWGNDSFDMAVKKQLEGTLMHGKKLVFKSLSHPAEAVHCEVVYIAPDSDSMERLLQFLEGQPVLTVSDVHRFIQRGGMVGMTLEENRIRFNINLEAAQKAKLKLSSQLLKLAKTIKGKPKLQPPGSRGPWFSQSFII